MNDLNAQQLILLALFVSFVTSIATGIFTVSLLEQAPPAVTQTINRVVEHTVETVVQGETKVVNTIKEIPAEDRITSAIDVVTPALVRVAFSSSVASATSSKVAALGRSLANGSYESVGFVLDAKKGLMVTALPPGGEETYDIVLFDDTRLPAEAVSRENGLLVLRLASTTSATFSKGVRLNTEPLSLGQTVFALGYDGLIRTVSLGVVSGYKAHTASSSAVIRTSIESSTNIIGAPIVTSGGEVIGLFSGSAGVIPAEILEAALKKE